MGGILEKRRMPGALTPESPTDGPREAGSDRPDNRPDLGQLLAAAVEAEVDGQEVVGRELVDPLDLKGLVGAGLDDRCKNAVAITPEASRWYVAVDLGVDLAHRNTELVAVVRRLNPFRQRKRVHKGSEFERMQHGHR